MKTSNGIINFIGLFLSVVCFALLLGCTEETDQTKAVDNNVSLTLHLNVSQSSQVTSKSFNTAQEERINPANIQILVFEQLADREVFRYQAPITRIEQPLITIQVPASQSNQRYRLVVFANTEVRSIVENTTKEEVVQQYIFNCAGKWDTSSSSTIPMWGELKEPITLQTNQTIQLSLYRALARVDVGLLFKYNNPDPITGEEYPDKETDKESVYGLANFKIKDIRVYRTKSQAYAASQSAYIVDDEVVQPYLPSASNYNSDSGTTYGLLTEADEHPLIYTSPTGCDRYIREIYIPESAEIDETSNMDNIPCLVVGGYYGQGNTEKVTYYRADFASYSRGHISAYRPILRDHQYIFDIKQVNGPGFPTPEQALKSINAPIMLYVEEWNLVHINTATQGNYHFTIEEREIWLDACPLPGQDINQYTIDYETNLELDGTTDKEISYQWASSGNTESAHFDIAFDYANKQIVITAKSDNQNTGEGTRSDQVVLTVENLQFTIQVYQRSAEPDYAIQCESVLVHGKYREGIALNYANYITLDVITQEGNYDGTPYHIRTIEKNGIHFEAEGVFDATQATYLGGNQYCYTLTIPGTGTPTNDSGEGFLSSFNLTITTNSSNPTTCTARIIVGYKTKKILTIGANAIYRYGYMLEPNTASRAFMDASVNFGIDPHSTVTMEENTEGNAFAIEVMTAGKGMSGEVIKYEYLLEMLNTFKPDIILTGQAINYFTSGKNTNVIDLLSSFVDQGGVFIMCNEYYPNASSIEAMVSSLLGGSSGNNQSIGYNLLFSLPDGSAYENDPILNGPFGDLRGKQWGADGHELYGFTSLPADEVVVYSNRTDGAACMFRHRTKGFFFVGDGGFISNSKKYIGNSYQGSYVYCPFAIDATYRPVARINYTLTHNDAVYNSPLFGNIIHWAVSLSEEQGIVYPDSGNKFPL